MVIAALAIAACGSSSAPARSTTSAPGSTSTSSAAEGALGDAPSTDDSFPGGLRDVRYCEILLLRKPASGYIAEVWNTLGLNDCPQAAWDALDATAIAKDRDALAAVKNGPRYWTLDAIVSNIRAGAPETTFGDLDMFQAATIDLGSTPPDQQPYVERSVVRKTIFRFRKGSEVYELTDPEGTTYIMQSYSQIKDPSLTIDQLPTLGGSLDLPAGWTYGARTLDADLDVRSVDGVATVVQDDLQNTYQLIDKGN